MQVIANVLSARMEQFLCLFLWSVYDRIKVKTVADKRVEACPLFVDTAYSYLKDKATIYFLQSAKKNRETKGNIKAFSFPVFTSQNKIDNGQNSIM